MKKYAKFQFDSISSLKVIKDLKTHKNAIIFVNHVSQILVTGAKFQVETLRRFWVIKKKPPGGGCTPPPQKKKKWVKG